jgi:NADH:ubiquinone oxidoreductase subunit K
MLFSALLGVVGQIGEVTTRVFVCLCVSCEVPANATLKRPTPRS